MVIMRMMMMMMMKCVSGKREDFLSLLDTLNEHQGWKKDGKRKKTKQNVIQTKRSRAGRSRGSKSVFTCVCEGERGGRGIMSHSRPKLCTHSNFCRR